MTPKKPIAVAPRADRLERQGRPVLATWTVALLLLVVLWWQVALQIVDSRQREVAGALRDLGNLTRVSQEHAERTLQSADQVIRFVRDRYLELGDRLDLQEMARRGVIDAANFPQIGIIDAQGFYVLSSQGPPSRLDLSDREHFRVHTAAGAGDVLFVSRPVLGRASGQWSLQLTRPITLPGGDFGGAAVLSLDPGYFTRFYGELQLGPKAVAVLAGLDGHMRARRAGEQDEFGGNLSTSLLFDRLREGEAVGSYSAVSPGDGVKRLVHFRRLAGYPLVVAAGLSMDEVLASHYATRRLLLAQAGLLSALVLGLAVLIARHLSRVRRELALRRVALRQVTARNDSLDALFSLSPDGFVGFDHGRLVKYVNPAFQQLIGAEDTELAGLHEQDFSRWLATRCQAEARFTRVDVDGQRIVVGAARRVLLVSSRPGDQGSLSRLLHFRDITREAAVDEQKSDVLATAAHELRTPIASIYGFSEVLATHPLSASERAEFVQIIHAQAGHMAQILDELLDLSRLESGLGRKLLLVPVDLQQLLAEVVRLYQPPAGRERPVFQGATPCVVAGDKTRLRQALLSVLVNAYKYSPADSVVKVSLGARRHGRTQQLGLRVVDNGVGMSAEEVLRVCERFYRADRSGPQSGTGLGMSIVKEIMTLHGGTVEIDSTLGSGTTVTLWLPAATATKAKKEVQVTCPTS